MPTIYGGLDVNTASVGTYPEVSGLEGWITGNPATQLKPLPNIQHNHEIPGDRITRAIVSAMGLDFKAIEIIASIDPEGIDLAFERIRERQEKSDSITLPEEHPVVTGRHKDGYFQKDAHHFMSLGNEVIEIVMTRNVLWTARRGDCGLIDAEITLGGIPETVLSGMEKKASKGSLKIGNVIIFGNDAIDQNLSGLTVKDVELANKSVGFCTLRL